jgi:glycosyltransferase involved in cell wall biosynthesis
MKVTISVGGRFHAFYLAQELEEKGCLDKLFTSHPWFSMKGCGIPRKKVDCLILKEIIELILYKVTFLNKNRGTLSYLADIFDRQVANRIKPCDIFVGWSSFALNTLKVAKSQGAKTIIERGSSHIEYQNNIMKEEYEQLGIKTSLSEPRIIEKELKEYDQADYISVPSNFAKNTFLEKGFSQDKLIQVPYGVNVNLFRPVPKEDSIFRVIFVGQMTIRKGLPYLLKAVSELRLKNFELWLIGSISDEIEPFFKEYREHFKHLGAINYNQLYKYYSQGSVFVLPSLEEGLSFALLQAMACGLPVICTTNTGGADLIEDKQEGFIVPIRDTFNLKKSLLYLYENPNLCQEMGKQARKKIESGFTWAHYGDKMFEAYKRVFTGDREK